MLEIDVLPASTATKGADSILIRFGSFNYNGYQNDQKIILIDGGYSETSEVIIDHIQSIYRSSEIDCVLCSHPDADHINGIISLIESDQLEIHNLCVHNPWNNAYGIDRKIHDNRTSVKSIKNRLDDSVSALDDLLEIANDRSIKLFEPFAGFNIYDMITVLGPTKDYYCNLVSQYPGMHDERSLSGEGELVQVKYVPDSGHFYKDPITSAKNDSSVVSLLNYDGFTTLFTGDCGVEGLTKALSYADNEGIQYKCVNYFQIPHHGSIKNINANILNKVDPNAAFVSAPADSHKHPSCLIMNYINNYVCENIYHVSNRKIRISHKAPERSGWGTVKKIPIFPYVYIPN